MLLNDQDCLGNSGAHWCGAAGAIGIMLIVISAAGARLHDTWGIIVADKVAIVRLTCGGDPCAQLRRTALPMRLNDQDCMAFVQIRLH